MVAQWADAHNLIAAGWVTGDPTHNGIRHGLAEDACGMSWRQFIKNNPAITQPQPRGLGRGVF